MVNCCENCHRQAVCLLQDLCTQVPWIFAPTKSAEAGTLLVDQNFSEKIIGFCPDGHFITLNDLTRNACLISLLGFEVKTYETKFHEKTANDN